MSDRSVLFPSEIGKRSARVPRTRAVVATVIGNALEWFDFAAYAFFATFIAEHFFPRGSELAMMLGTFAAFGVGFVARPLGAIAFGRIGDRVGRRTALLIALPLMGLGTLLVGITPSFDRLGIAAPVLLTIGRLVQGLSAGGELGNAIAFLIEWAPPNRRALYSSLQQGSVIVGTLVGSGSAALLTTTLSATDLHSWGWRLPFLLGGLVVAPLGIFLRRLVEESPAYEAAATAGPSHRRRSVWTAGLQIVGLTVAWITSYYVFLIYLPTFLSRYAGLTAAISLWASTLGLASMLAAIPLWAAVSDRVGRRPPLLAAAAVTLALSYPAFSVLVDHPTVGTAFLISVGAGFVIGAFAGVGPAVMSELLPTSARTTGVSVAFGLATAIFGGFAPFIATYLIAWTESPLAPTIYVITAAVVSLLTVVATRETAWDALS